MYRRPRLVMLCALSCAGALWLAAAAGARTIVVTAGAPKSSNLVAAKYLSKSFAKRYHPNVNAFFNQRTTINVGDTVSFYFDGFHTVDLPGRSHTDLPLVVRTRTIANGFKDAAGNPFWFNGKLPLLGLNPQLFSRSKAHSYSGTKRLDSGIRSSKPFNVVFTKPGTYKFFCDVHPGMIGYVTVRPSGVQIPSVRQDLKALLTQETKDIKATKQAARGRPPARTIILGQSAPGGVELDALFPAKLTVKAGTVVTFRMSAHSRETHTATFGPRPYLNRIIKNFQTGPIFLPVGTYLSDPSRPLTLTPTSHGNSFLSTGLLDNDPSTKQFRSSTKIDFTTRGTYHFVCLIHPFMRGTIIVK